MGRLIRLQQQEIAMNISRSACLKAAAAVLALAGLGTASVAQARDNINWSVGIGVPGVAIGASNGYYGHNNYPVYTQPAPIYAPAPVYPSSYYVQPAPIYYSSPVYVQPAQVYIGAGSYGHGHRGHRGHRGHGHRR
jgi:hypothetical protein